MFVPEYALYQGGEHGSGVTDFAAENDYFIIVEFNHDVPKETTRERIDLFKQKILQSSSFTLESFRSVIDDVFFSELNVVDISICAGIVQENFLYVVTKGKGAVYIQRGTVFEAIIRGDNAASGKIEKGDTYILTSGNFQASFSEQDIIRSLIDKSPKEAVSFLTTNNSIHEEKNSIALYIRFKEQYIEEKTDESNTDQSTQTTDSILWTTSYADSVKNLFYFITSRFSRKNVPFTASRLFSKKIIMFIFAILAGIFIWSIFLGYQRRVVKELERRAEEYKTSINSLLEKARETGDADFDKTRDYLTEAERQIILLEKVLQKQKNDRDTTRYKKLVDEVRSKIERKKEAVMEEAYDLALINNKASGSRMFFADGSAVILDKKRKTVYVVDPEKKSHEDYTDSRLEKAEYTSYYNGVVYAYGESIGVIKSSDDKSFVQIIPKDDELKNVRGLWVYNGNIYLLATGNDEIYKYLVGENGYSNKTSYFKPGESLDLEGANSFAIDSSIYIGFPKKIIKYSAGVKEDFSLAFSKENMLFDKIFTDKNNENIYILDKKMGAVFLVDKKGALLKQLISESFKTADDIGALGDSIYILSNNKILKTKP